MKHSKARATTRRALIRSVAWLVCAAPEALAVPEATLGPASLAGQLLVAASTMRDPRFARTVILMVRHTRDGALGIVINRPIGRHPLAELLQASGADAAGIKGEVLVFLGGPVEPNAGFVIHSSDYRRQGTIDIDGRVAMTGSPEVLRDIGHGAGPAKSLIAFGYAGWGAGQLEAELARGDWGTTPEEPRLVFDADRVTLWAVVSDRSSSRP